MRRTPPEVVDRLRTDIAEAALELLGDVRFEEVVQVITPERLSKVGPWAPSTVRYHFGGGGTGDGRPRDYGFRRRDLAVAMVERAFGDLERACESAATEILESVDSGAVFDRDYRLDLLARQVADFIPGGGDDEVQARDRAILLAYAVCDDDAELARLLREQADSRREACADLVQGVLAALRREMRPDRRLDDLASAVLALVSSHLMACRFDVHADSGWVADAVVALAGSMTRPIEVSQT